MIGVVADDITGANDVGVMFTAGGYTADVYSYDLPLTFPLGRPDVVVLDTDSRLDDPATAYRKVREATRKLIDAGCTLFYKKTCSVLRGNVGPELDGMLDELGQDFAIVAAGFPKNGRQTIGGIHYVRGVELAKSEFRNDPVHPMRESNLVKILTAQTRRQVDFVDHRVVSEGPEFLRQHIERARTRCNYLVIDVVDQNSLKTIAEAVGDRYLIGGSSALGEELPSVLGPSSLGSHSLPVAPYDGTGILCAAGSLMPQTRAQVEMAVDRGALAFELDTVRLMESDDSSFLLAKLSESIVKEMQAGRDVVVHTSSEPEAVAVTKKLGTARGLSNTAVSRLVSESMAQVVKACLEATGQRRFLIAGGDTSAAVCAELGIKGMRVWREIQAGVPSCYSLDGEPRLFVLKSGSFGQPDFFIQAIEHLKAPDAN